MSGEYLVPLVLTMRQPRGIFGVRIPAGKTDLESFIKVRTDGRNILFPSTAPDLSQTVIVN
jgi:hypothetical protein